MLIYILIGEQYVFSAPQKISRHTEVNSLEKLETQISFIKGNLV